MHRFFLLVVLLLHLAPSAQIDQDKLDSLARSIDSSAKAYKNYQDSFNKKQDSIYHAAVEKDLKQNSGTLDKFLPEQRRKEVKERQKNLLRIVTGVVFLITAITILRRSKESRKPN